MATGKQHLVSKSMYLSVVGTGAFAPPADLTCMHPPSPVSLDSFLPSFNGQRWIHLIREHKLGTQMVCGRGACPRSSIGTSSTVVYRIERWQRAKHPWIRASRARAREQNSMLVPALAIRGHRCPLKDRNDEPERWGVNESR
jgi:hypothetical protein